LGRRERRKEAEHVAGETEPLLHIWLVADEGDGRTFMADIHQMLRRLAERDGVVLTAVAEPIPSHALPDHVFERASGGVGPSLLGEMGIHRAQLVPEASLSGRIATSAVGVELVSPGGTPSIGRPAGHVLKTYNYVLRRVTRHATGQRLPLDAVLSGEA
jgi:protein subunit release factor A